VRIGDLLRDPLPKQPDQPTVEGLPNFYAWTRYGIHAAPFGSGINPIRWADTVSGRRRPAVIIRSSPHKAGSAITPWEDTFEPDRGHVRYFGDSKVGRGIRAHEHPGNKELLRLLEEHRSPFREVRARAAPLVFFQTVRHRGKEKGHVRFHGIGLITDAELVTQLDRATGAPFSNYVYDCLVVSLAPENERFQWDWINARRGSEADDAVLAYGPAAWQDWVANGDVALPRVRRRVATLLTTPPALQRPLAGSREDRTLKEVYAYYERRKHRFEALAEIIAERVIAGSGVPYRRGWITRGSGDRGIDFVGRIDLGHGFGAAAVVVLGQAKCESPSQATGGVHIARTVARLRRGWVGVYVTTSFFSGQVQEEIYEDRYPIVLINGRRLAEEVNALVIERGLPDVASLLGAVDATYDERLAYRHPEEILSVV
jgi:hypothetical protein